MATILDTLITRLGFETDTRGLDKAEKGLTDFKDTAFKIAASIGAVLGGGFFLVQTAQAAIDVKKFADGLGLTVEEMSEMDFAAKKLNVPIETLRGQFFNLTQALNEASETGAGITDDLDRFGLSATDAGGNVKDLTVFLSDVRRKMQALTSIQKADLADKLFFDEETIALLTVAPDRIAEITKESRKLGILSRKDAESAKKFNDGLVNMVQIIESIKFTIGGFVFEPIANFFKLLEDGIDFIKQHKVLTISFIGILGLLAAAYNAAAIKAGILWLISLGPIALVVAGIAAVAAGVAILIEDFTAFFKGQSSFIGDLVKKWPLLGDVIFAVRDAVVGLFNGTVAGFKIWFGWLEVIGQAMIDFIVDPIDTAMKAFNKFSGLFKKAKGFFGDIGGVSLNQELGIAGVGGTVSPSILSGGQSTKITKSLSVGKVVVDARGGDSKEIAQNVGAAMAEQFKNTVEDFDSPVDK